MPIDFFKAQCILHTSEIKFGICDDDNKSPAYLNNSDESVWIAKVQNNESKLVIFTAIDNCIDFPLINGEMPSRCDAMLTCDNCVYVIELKNKRSDWKSSGIDQLEATITYLINELGEIYYNFRLRKAYVANRRHPNFHVIENETMEKFRDKYKVRLHLEAIIRIV